MFIQIITHTIEANSLDTITKHLTDINHQLVSIKKDTSSKDTIEMIKTIGLVVGPILTGYIFFVLNRSKEYKFKLSDICGEIYLLMYELKHARVKHVYQEIICEGLKRQHEIIIAIESNKSIEQQILGFSLKTEITNKFKSASDEMEKHTKETNEIRKKLEKYLGQYRFYLSNRQKKKFDKLKYVITHVYNLRYDFSERTSLEDIRKKVDVHLSTFRADLEPKINNDFSKIENFIDKNN